MKIDIEIDEGSGFCFGVTRAIGKAEEELRSAGRLYCLGDIVHNGQEVERLRRAGLHSIDHAAFAHLQQGERVLLRAHGEPPATYQTASQRGIKLIDATCPVVLQLQKRVRQEYQKGDGAQIVIYGKPGHAEVLGLVGQTDGHAVVIEHPDEADRLDFKRDIRLFSQTTMPLDGFGRMVESIKQRIVPPATFRYFDTICRQVSGRRPHVEHFATRHDVLLFVCGHKSSNGRVLYEACRRVNPRSYMVDAPSEIDFAWLEGARSVGICGATSTPRWLMQACREAILAH